MDTNNHKSILIIDDEEDICALLKRILETGKPDYQIVTTPDGFSAIGWLMQQEFELVLTDWRIGNMDGLELAGAIHNIWPNTRILLMTGTATPELNDAIKSLGLNGWVEKPFTPTHIFNLVEQAMG